MRLHQSQHHLRGDGGIERVAALIEDFDRRRRGVRVGGRHHALALRLAAGRGQKRDNDDEDKAGDTAMKRCHGEED